MQSLTAISSVQNSRATLSPTIGCTVHHWAGEELLSWWTTTGLKRLSWISQIADHEHPEPEACDPSFGKSLTSALAAYSQGEVKAFDAIAVDLSDLPAFSRLVLEECRQILPGRVLTYGQLAHQIGAPNAARGVGQAMARNPVPLVIPCHRVVGSGGTLTGYSGRGGLDTKRKLLRWESARSAGHSLNFDQLFHQSA